MGQNNYVGGREKNISGTFLFQLLILMNIQMKRFALECWTHISTDTEEVLNLMRTCLSKTFCHLQVSLLAAEQLDISRYSPLCNLSRTRLLSIVSCLLLVIFTLLSLEFCFFVKTFPCHILFHKLHTNHCAVVFDAVVSLHTHRVNRGKEARESNAWHI